MPQSLANILVHFIFSTKNRQPVLSDVVRPLLWRYLAGALDALDCRAIQIGGTADHVHILCHMSRNIAACKVVEEVKKESSKWIKQQGNDLSDFYWQGGYGAFSVGQSGVAATESYILRQEEHHRQVSFQDEYRRFLAKYHVPFDERYVWD
jgi:REP element-mobilizing transposase RayT